MKKKKRTLTLMTRPLTLTFLCFSNISQLLFCETRESISLIRSRGSFAPPRPPPPSPIPSPPNHSLSPMISPSLIHTRCRFPPAGSSLLTNDSSLSPESTCTLIPVNEQARHLSNVLIRKRRKREWVALGEGADAAEGGADAAHGGGARFGTAPLCANASSQDTLATPL